MYVVPGGGGGGGEAKHGCMSSQGGRSITKHTGGGAGSEI